VTFPWGAPTDVPVRGDFDGDGKTEIAVWRPSTGDWYIIQSSNGEHVTQQWGVPTDIPVAGDFDGDGKTDIAVWRPSTGNWYIIQSSNGAIVTKQWGAPTDIPVVGDFDGDGKSDIAVWRPSTGYWYIIQSSNSATVAKQWGLPTDVPLVGDFDGDGKSDIAVWRPSTGDWYITLSSNGEVTTKQWGASTDVPVVGDYDGDGKSDIAVWRPSTGYWYVVASATRQVLSQQWGETGDKPVQARYGGGTQTEITVWRPANGTWYVLSPTIVAQPTVRSISPSSAIAGGAAFTLTVTGTNFIPGSTVDWNAGGRITTYQSATRLTALITGADIASAGSVPVTVVNPSPGGGTSSAVNLSITNPAPAVSSLSPATVTVGGAAFTLTVNGSGFDTASVVQWNGSPRTTTFVNATKLTASINAADIAVSGNVTVTVATPPPGGGTSAELGVVLRNPSPTVTTLSQISAAAGGAAFTLSITGTNFTPGSVVQWNGTNQITTYVSPTQLTVQITAADIATAGSATVSVLNGAPGGGISSATQVTLTGTLPANAYFVAPNGNDANPGTISQPYLTIQKCATTVASGSTCYIRAGTYPETVTPNSGITISSYDGETVTVDGSDVVTGWTLYQGSIYQATVTLSTGDTNQLFANGQMMTEARWPNGNDLFHVNWATLGSGTTTTLLVDSSLPNINWTGAKIHFWSGTDPADVQTATVTSSAAGQLNFSLDGIGNTFYNLPQPGGYYYLYRLFAALDAPNEWYYDSSSHVLYFWAPGGVNPNTLLMRAKQRPYAFDLSGKSNVTIEYLNLFASTINSNSSSTGNTINGINAQYLSQFTDLPDKPPPGVEATDTYYTLHTWDTGIIVYGTANVVENSVIEWSAGNGVAVAGSGNTVKNNLIDHVDYMGIDAAGVTAAGLNQEIQNNTVYVTGRYAIYLSDWYYGTEAGLPNGVNVDVSYNNVYAAEILSTDAGAIYTGETQGVTGSAIHHNWVHDSQALYSMIINKNPQYPLPGVYLDQHATGWNVYQNVLWNNQVANIYLYETGDGTAADFPPQNDQIYNNTIPDVADTGYIWLAGILNCGTTQITNNIVLVPVLQNDAVIPSSCPATNNSATAPGANQMTSSVQVGCNFAGCATAGPPTISGTLVSASIAVQPYGLTVQAGQTATFSVTGAGSPPLSYQWQRNGVNISGATATTYTTPATVAVDSGAVFSVTVSNSIGGVTSTAAVLTVD
jgi:hypothetical protein